MENLLNNLDPSLKFTTEYSDFKVSFLNLLIYKEDHKIMSDIYYKDTDTHDYLPFNSCHPRHVTINIPGNLARMICTIVDNPDRRTLRLQELSTWLGNSGYPPGLINEQFQKIIHVDQAILRQKVTKEDDKTIVFVQTHNPKNPHVFWYLRQQFDSLISSRKFSRIFKDFKIIKGERQPKNLGRILQKSNICPNILPNGSFKCNKSSCGTCDYIQETNVVHFNSEEGLTHFKLFKHFNCRSQNVIYKITCKGCLQYYIGETVHLQHRVSSHKFQIRNK